jgi:lipopolysaccharide transport system permease protein
MQISTDLGTVVERLNGVTPAPPATQAAEPEPHGTSGEITWILPPSGWQVINLRELWQHRELLYFLIWRDIKVRYKQTVLGASWAILQPLMMMVVFTIFLGRLANLPSGDVPYPLFVFAGLLPWTFFASALTQASNSVVVSERVITKVYFPRLAVPFAAVGAAVVDFAFALGMLVVLMVWYGVAPGFGLLLAPVIFLFLLLAATGAGTFLAALNVSYRDFRYVIPFLVQVWMFATPTVYMAVDTEKANHLQTLMMLNPVTSLIGNFRAFFLGGPIDWLQLGISGVCALSVFLVGCLYFRRVEDRFADII